LSNNPLLVDELFVRCRRAANSSPCQKMKFGCVITREANVIYEGCNRQIPALKSVCEPHCIRLLIASRTEPMIGACGHAEEGMWDLVQRRVPLQECDLYIAGFFPSGEPWLKDKPEHSCLRCATQMHYAQIRTIFVPVINRWEGISTDLALTTALAYALRQREINPN
jgi:deoxycytidylate deaminase